MSIKQLQIDILAKDKTLRAFNSVNRGLSNVQRNVFNLRNALIGIGGIAVLKGFFDAGVQIENLGVQLNALFGSAQKGQKALDQVTEFAKTTPFNLRNIQQGITALATVSDRANELGIDFDELLKITGNTAVILGGDFALASLQIQRSFSAGIGSAELFRERGVRAMAGFEEGVKVSVDDSITKLAEAFGTGGQYGQLMGDLAKTTSGTISNLQDAFLSFQIAVASGFFPALKRELGDLKDIVDDNADSIRKFGESVGTNLVKAFERSQEVVVAITPALITVKNVLGEIIDGFLKLPKEIQTYGLIGGVLFGKKGVAILAGASLATNKLDEIKKFMNEFLLFGEQVKFSIFEALGLDEQANESLNTILEIQERIANLNKVIEEANQKGPLEVQIKVMDHAFAQGQLGALNNNLEESKKRIDGLKEAMAGFKIGFTGAMKDAIKITDDFEKLGKKAFDGFADSLTDAIMTGKASFKDFARSLLADLLRIIIRQQLAVQLQRILGFGSAVAGGGGIIASIPKLFGFANGGTPPVNRPSIVGERGPELFIPKSSGTVVPNEKMMGGTTNINFTINTVDAQGVDELLTNRRSTIINVINDALNRQGKEALV
jgi:hypothetical protein